MTCHVRKERHIVTRTGYCNICRAGYLITEATKEYHKHESQITTHV